MIQRPTTPDAPLFDRSKADAARDEAVARVTVDEEWRKQAVSCIRHCAASQETFTVDDVQEALERAGIVCPTDRRAMGSVMTSMKLDGEIEATGQYTKTRRVSSHSGPRMVWRRAS